MSHVEVVATDLFFVPLLESCLLSSYHAPYNFYKQLVRNSEPSSLGTYSLVSVKCSYWQVIYKYKSYYTQEREASSSLDSGKVLLTSSAKSLLNVSQLLVKKRKTLPFPVSC